jgi:hypothetical protein
MPDSVKQSTRPKRVKPASYISGGYVRTKMPCMSWILNLTGVCFCLLSKRLFDGMPCFAVGWFILFRLHRNFITIQGQILPLSLLEIASP